jgi:phosphatidylinositol-3-phosphatase
VRSALAKLARLDPTRLDLALPRPWVCVLLVLAFLGFGVLLGRTASGAREVLSASARPQLRLVLPPTAGSTTSQSSVPPPSEPAATPSASSPEASAAGESNGGGEGSQSENGSGSKGAGSGGQGSGGQGSGGKGSGGKGSGGGSGGSGGGSGGSTGTGGGGSGGSTGGGGGSGGGQGSGPPGGGGSSAKLPPVKHVFLIMLADEPYASVFGPSSGAPYLANTLERRGELLVRYYAVAHDELADGIALLSGQGPTPQTEVNCPTFADVAPATAGTDGQVLGQGCVYPASTATLAGQLTAKHLTWRAYVEGMGAAPPSPSPPSTTCVHPALGAADPTLDPTPPAAPTTTGPAASSVPPAYEALAGAGYATFRNPFVYFHSVIDGPRCAADDVPLSRLARDLRSPTRTPSLAYIVPSLCDDGSPLPCAPGRPAGLPPVDAFLRRVVPPILASKAYKHGGLLVITVDQAPATGADADSSSCCGQPRFSVLPPPPSLPGGGSLPPSGGGQVGALLLSPFVKPGTTNQEPFNHFSLLRTIENLFGLAHLGYAAGLGVGSFEASVFSAYSG